MAEEEKSGFSLAKGSTEVLSGKKDSDIGYTGVLSGGVAQQSHVEVSEPVESYRPDYVEDTGNQFEVKKLIVPVVVLLILVFSILEYLNII